MSDLIDRQAAIDEFEKELSAKYNRRELAIGFVGIKSILENLPSAQRWIPCSERLPESLGKYLITYYFHGDWVCGIDYFRPYRNEGKWKNHTVVRAWMPLPEPYEGE